MCFHLHARTRLPGEMVSINALIQSRFQKRIELEIIKGMYIVFVYKQTGPYHLTNEVTTVTR